MNGRELVVGVTGGVAANSALRKRVATEAATGARVEMPSSKS